jgi:6-pyruvoyltetrahydropterin/6-carboxytetrahydropterin synthase
LATRKQSTKGKGAIRSLSGEVVVTRRVHFNAAHRLHNPDRSAAWNRRVFGLCNSKHWHGHNYVLEVSVRGRPGPETGFVIDLGELKGILNARVADVCDHKNLNQDVPFLRGLVTSTENLVIAFWNEIEPHLPSGKLHRVRLYETERNFADYYGNQARDH